MNKINDRDLTELSSYWMYQDINLPKSFFINGKRFRQIDEFNDNANQNSHGASDVKIFELFDKR